MAQYIFEGVDKQGTKVTQTIDAATENDLRMVLRSKGIRPTKIKRADLLNKNLNEIFGGKSIPTEVIVILTRQLYVLINSGIPLMQALDILHEQAVTAQSKSMIGALRDKVSKGSYLWEALAAHPASFSKLYVALVRAGEASGSLDQMLKRLSRYMEDSERLKKLVKAAMIYPSVVITIGIVVIAVMLIFVIPKFEEMLKQNKQELPALTQFVISSSHFLVDHVVQIGGATTVLAFLLIRYFKSKEGRALRDQIFFYLPLFGKIIQMAGVARFSRTLQTLISSGVNLVDAIDICRSAIDNVVLESATARIRTDIEGGLTLGMAIKKINAFPKMTYQMIQVGESTGNLDKMLEKIADFYESDVENLVGGLSKLIEPFILVFLGVTVGGMMLAMYLPIFKMAAGAGD